MTFIGIERSVEFAMALQRSEFVKRLRQAREVAGYTQQQAADKLGVSIKTYNRWEALNNGAYPRQSKFDDLSELFDVPREYLQGPAPQLEQTRLEDIERLGRENNIMLRALLAHFDIRPETLAEPPADLLAALGDGEAKSRKRRGRV